MLIRYIRCRRNDIIILQWYKGSDPVTTKLVLYGYHKSQETGYLLGHASAIERVLNSREDVRNTILKVVYFLCTNGIGNDPQFV